MINKSAIKRLDTFYKKWHISAKTRKEIEINVAVFTLLKKEYRKGNICNNALFKWAFLSFYVNTNHRKLIKDSFFTIMESLRQNKSVQDPQKIARKLKKSMNRYFFVYVTKMLNLIDDKQYPIYDSNVFKVFKNSQRHENMTSLEFKSSIYQDIKDTYKELRGHKVIKRFKREFKCHRMGSYKVLDTIFWIIGKNL